MVSAFTSSFLAFVTAAAVSSVSAEPIPRATAPVGLLTDEVKAGIAAVLKQNGMPGYSMTIVGLGGPDNVEHAFWGNRTEAGDKVDELTVNGIGSMSKAFTATALGLVMDDFAHGRNTTPLPPKVKAFTVQSKLADLLPGDWKLMDDYASKKTAVHDLLTHESGMPRHDLSYNKGETALEVIRSMQYLRPAFELRQTWHYTNIQYGVIQYLIERYSGKTLPEFVNERILKPLNMTSSTYSFKEATAGGHVSESWNVDTRRIPHWLLEEDIALVGGAGGIMSSASDMVNWAKLLLGSINGTAIGIPEKILQNAMSPQALIGANGMTYGYGWIQQAYAGNQIVFHTGSVPGVSAQITILPKQKIAVIQNCNADSKDDYNMEIVLNLLGAALNPSKASPATNTTARARSIKVTGYALGHGPGQHAAALSTEATETTTNKDTQPIEPNTLAGTYYDPAYDTLILCSTKKPSSECRDTLSSFTALQNGSLNPAQLYGYFPKRKFWAKHVRLTPLPTFNVTSRYDFEAMTVFPEGYGANKTPFAHAAARTVKVRAQFQLNHDKVEGMGLFNYTGAPLEREMTGKTVEEKAEVWFKRK